MNLKRLNPKFLKKFHRSNMNNILGNVAYYSEEIIYMPHSYQPNDNTRQISKKEITRSDMGLPEDSFVFCSFNNSYKITSQEFEIWMLI